MKRMSGVSSCMVGLWLAVFLLAAESHAQVRIKPRGSWKIKEPIVKITDPPGDARAEARGSGEVVTSGRSQVLQLKPFASVRNSTKETAGVYAEVVLEFWRYYETTRVSSGEVWICVRTKKDPKIVGTLTTQNPFFDPNAHMTLEVQVEEVDRIGYNKYREKGPKHVFPVWEHHLHNDLKVEEDKYPPGTRKPKGDNAGTLVLDVPSTYFEVPKGKFHKEVYEVRYYKVWGKFRVWAGIKAVAPLSVRKTRIAELRTFAEIDAHKSILKTWTALMARAEKLVNLDTGVLTEVGESGLAEANFETTLNLIVDSTYTAPGVLAADVDIYPKTVNLNGRGEWVTCNLQLPEGYDVADIDVASIRMDNSLEVQRSHLLRWLGKLMLEFDRSEVLAMLGLGEADLTLTGELNSGLRFEGSDTIRVVDRPAWLWWPF